jgi:hypothetical protein
MSRVSQEFDGLRLGDARLDRRAALIAESLSAAPDASFPDMTADDGELEALYRFVNNDRVTPEELLRPHFEATVRRAASANRVVVAHDTTGFSFGGETEREGLGRMKSASTHHSQGFYGHFALAADAGTGVPLGVIGMIPVVRTDEPIPYPDQQSKRHERVREFERWSNLIDVTCTRLTDCQAIHVMDREADAYELFCKLAEKPADFVIRSKDDRILDVPQGDKQQPRYLHAAIERGRYVMTREVELSTKRPDRLGRLRKASGRMKRLAKLEVTVTQVDIRHPPYVAGKSRKGSTLPRAVSVNVVSVREVDAPSEQPPVDWVLLTTLPIDDLAEVELVIDSYRRRWLIEEYFKCLKKGCAYEKRQLESKHALLNALALFVPIAWRLLALRSLARETPDEPGLPILSVRLLKILKARGKRPMSQTPTFREAMLAIAAEGGHIKNNGDPGWQVLARGYVKLLYMELGYLLAKKRAPKM